jgi:hypothetical protein
MNRKHLQFHALWNSLVGLPFFAATTRRAAGRQRGSRALYLEYLEQRQLLSVSLGDVSLTAHHNSTLTVQQSDFADVFLDTSGGSLGYVQFTSTHHGTLLLNGTALSDGQILSLTDLDSLTYQPAANWVGLDTFSWAGSRDTTFTSTATVTIDTQESIPTLANLSIRTGSSKTYTFTTADFTSKFTDGDPGDSLQYVQIWLNPSVGTLTLNGTAVTTTPIPVADLPNLKYIANATASGTDSFQWRASDGTEYSTAAYGDISFDNTAPTIDTVSKTIGWNTPKAFTAADFTASFTDADPDDTLHSIQILSLPAQGTLTLNGIAVKAQQVITLAQIPQLKYSPQKGYIGADSFQWEASDGVSFSSASFVVLTVEDTVPTVSSISIKMTQNTKKTFSATPFANAFSDADIGDKMTYVMMSLPTYGTLSLSGVPLFNSQVIPASKLKYVTYTPNANFAGVDTIYWTASDGQKYATASSITIGVTGKAPVVAPIYKGVIENSTGMHFDAWDFTNSFTELNLGPILQAVQIVTLPTHGTLYLNTTENAVTAGQVITASATSSDGSTINQIAELLYVPTVGYTGSDKFSWNASDGIKSAATASTVNLTVVAPTGLVVSSNGYVIPSGSTHTSTVERTDFGQVGTVANSTTQSDTRTYVITNYSSANITFTGGTSLIQITGANAGDFTASSGFTDLVQGNTVTTLLPNQSATFTVTFSPSASGNRNAKIQIPVSSGSAYTFNVSGTGLITYNVTSGSLTGFQYLITKAGSGSYAVDGSIVTVNYTGYLLDGTIFDSSLNPGRSTFQFHIGELASDSLDPGVITGWNQGLYAMQIGEERTIIVPASLAYGSSANGSIPANSTLIFKVQCVSIADGRVSVAVSGGSNMIISGTTTTSTANGTDFGSLTATQSSMTTTFNLYNVAYSYQGYGTDSAYHDFTPDIYLSNSPSVYLSGPNASDFTLIAVDTSGTLISGGAFQVQFNKPADTTPRYATITVYTSDAVTPAFTFTIKAAAAAYVDLSPTVGTTHLPTTVTAGDRTTLTVPITVKNYGNVASSGTTDVGVYAYSPTSGTETLIATLANVNLGGIAPRGGTKSVTLNVTLPVGFSPGNYQIRVHLNDSHNITEASFTNNTATTTQTITTTSGLVDLTGTLTTTTVPVSIIAGQALNYKLGLQIANLGNVLTPANQSLTVDIYAYNVNSSQSTKISTSTLSVASLASNGTHAYTIPIKYTSGLPAGTYELQVQLSPTPAVAEVGTANNLIILNSSGQQFTFQSIDPYYDLTPSLRPTNLPQTSIISGNLAQLALPITITNNGNVASVGVSDILVYAIDTTTHNEIPIQTFSNVNFSGIAAHGSKTITLTTTLPIGFTTGNYQLAVRLNSGQTIAESSYTNNSVATTQTITVQQGLPDFSVAVRPTNWPQRAIISGNLTNLTLPITITNNGNVISAGTTDIVVYAIDTTTQAQIDIQTFSNVSLANIAAGGTKTLTLTTTLPIGFATGTYRLAVRLNSSNTLLESNSANNSASSTETISVIQGLPDLTGTISDTLPPAIVANATVNGSVTVVVKNQGNVLAPVNQPVRIQIIAHNTDTSQDITLATSGTLSLGTLTAGASKSFAIPINYTSGLAAGNYTLEAQITPITPLLENSTTNNLVTLNAAGQPLTVLAASPFNDLSGTFGASTLPTANTAGTALSGRIYVNVTNNGNQTLPSGQTVQVALVAHTASGDVALKTVTVSLSLLAPGATKAILLTVSLPAGLPAGTYALQATISDVPTLAESDLTNNLVTLNGSENPILLTVT